LNTEGDIDMSVTGPVFNGSSVFMWVKFLSNPYNFTIQNLNGTYQFVFCRYEGWYAGYQLTYNGTTSALTNNNIAAGYYGSDFTVHGALWVVTYILL